MRQSEAKSDIFSLHSETLVLISVHTQLDSAQATAYCLHNWIVYVTKLSLPYCSVYLTLYVYISVHIAAFTLLYVRMSLKAQYLYGP